ncbi:cold shock domain-containing protein [Microvirga sp. W0021]|uniref:Cold shock domain-containing protein n=1 Tax=Hohaiivirga grylli TaxID=3133970 RepID=A0ABV0BK71_9HYPH
MGRGNDYRDRGDRRRGGFGNNDFPQNDPWGDYTPPRPAFERRPAPGGRAPVESGPETEAKVKWFNGDKGFGFVEMTDGSGEAFIHIRAVESAGVNTLDPGTTLVVRVGQGQKGAQVTEVLSVDASTAEPAAPRGAGGGFGGGAPRRGPQGGGFAPRQPIERDLTDAPEASGIVKWYDATKGFGFVAVEGESKDLFVHRTVLGDAGLASLMEGQRVRVKIVEGRKGLEVGSIELE